MISSLLRRAVPLGLLCLTIACSPAPPETVAELPDIDTAHVLADITRLASDEFQGRAPGGEGERLTVDYLINQFTAAGLEPGNPDGSFVQDVPLVSVRPLVSSPFTLTQGGRSRTLRVLGDVVPFSTRVAEEVSLTNSEMVFVGYGIQAPEFGWDDYKGLDVTGKTLLMLVNDPPIAGDGPEGLDPAVFGGKAMTYYGRWVYKFAKAAELGAAGVLVIHEEGPAGYPFSVAQGMGGERFNLVTPDKNMSRAAVEGWISLGATTELFTSAGLDFDALKTTAATREFAPVSLKTTASVTLTQTLRTIDSQNVIAKITGSDPTLKDEYVIYSAHWDHLGVSSQPRDGDAINNGAMDNASGTAAMLEIARAFKAINPAPKRTILFLAVTAEEQGLLGSEFYAKFPLYPLERTLANINVDGMNMWGRTTDLTVVGYGASDLDDYLTEAAAEQGRTLIPDPESEKGFYYRSDHFNFAKVGVPALYTDDGVTFVGKPADYGKQKRDEFNRRDYHAPSDEVKPDWDLSGLAEDAKLLLAVGYRVAMAATYPEWKPGNEFKAARDKMLNR
ncbi:MAG: M28 family metallopeptidase [Acidobacteria bacterium]|nr:M28 family metallopeptidase [Acidobacteriota bacterium]